MSCLREWLRNFPSGARIPSSKAREAQWLEWGSSPLWCIHRSTDSCTDTSTGNCRGGGASIARIYRRARSALNSRPLQGALASLIVANSNRVIHTSKEYFAVANFARSRRGHDCLHGFLDHVIRQHHFNFYLRDQVDGVLAASVKLRMTLLPAVPAHLEHRHALDTDLVQRLFYRIELRRLDDRFNFCHRRLFSIPGHRR